MIYQFLSISLYIAFGTCKFCKYNLNSFQPFLFDHCYYFCFSFTLLSIHPTAQYLQWAAVSNQNWSLKVFYKRNPAKAGTYHNSIKWSAYLIVFTLTNHNKVMLRKRSNCIRIIERMKRILNISAHNDKPCLVSCLLRAEKIFKIISCFCFCVWNWFTLLQSRKAKWNKRSINS